MCGILFYMNHVCVLDPKLLKCRGPDQSTSKLLGRHSVAFSRLSINDTTILGMQPFKCGRWSVVCNGEIYNHKRLRKEFYNFTSESDCEVIVKLLYASSGDIKHVYNNLDGEFAMVATDGDRVVAARDHVGVRPLYMQTGINGYPYIFSSLIKAMELINKNAVIKHFPPGYVYDSTIGFIQMEPDFIPKPMNCYNIVYLLTESVRKRTENSDRNIGFLLSGGLDSTIIACIGMKVFGTIKTFSVGFHKDSSDLKYAREVARYLQSEHTEYILDIETAFNRIPEIVYAIETYDCTTIRASVPMYLMCERIRKETNIKVLLSGEGSDELFGGYIYSHNAPCPESLFQDSVRLLKNIHKFDGLRADRCVGSWGMELRVPFLDKNFVRYVMEIDPKVKMSNNVIEKKLLREAFKNDIPESVYKRSKNGMSDAVGKEWIQYIKQKTNEAMSDIDYGNLKVLYKHLTPVSKEEAWYRYLYHKTFPYENCNVLTSIWRPQWTNEVDPSARQLMNFKETL